MFSVRKYKQQAMQHPAEIYESPGAVLKDPHLTLNAKMRVLQNWADSVQQKLIATSENMALPSNEEEEQSCEDLLQNIHISLALLNEQSDRPMQ